MPGPALLLLLAAAPIRCPEGATLKHETSAGASSEWFICEKDGRREGPFAFVSNGHVAMCASYAKGLLEGEQLGLREDGTVGTRTRFRAGEKHGLEELWYLNGRKMFEQEWRNGREHGSFRRWREDGSLVVESEWADGEPQRYAAYYPNGARRFAAHAPLPDTTVYEWDEHGKLVREVKLVNGLEPSDRREGSDEGHLSCPKATFGRVKALGVGYPEDRCGGRPVLAPGTGRMETFAWAPRKAGPALRELGCEFSVTRPGEDLAVMGWQSYFHSKASVGE